MGNAPSWRAHSAHRGKGDSPAQHTRVPRSDELGYVRTADLTHTSKTQRRPPLALFTAALDTRTHTDISPTVNRTAVRLLIVVFIAALCVTAVALLRSPEPDCLLPEWYTQKHHDRHDALIREIAAKHGLDPNLIKAIVWRESAFDAGRSHDGAIGLMQLGGGTGAEWAAAHGIETFMATDLFDPRTNLEAGCWYLAGVAKRWQHRDDSIPFALAEYHAGPEAARRWAATPGPAVDFLRAIDAPATREFITSVLQRRESYERR
jgi:soluble lytic murein transglycosylase